jgi:hypothetical protein
MAAHPASRKALDFYLEGFSIERSVQEQLFVVMV